MNTPKEKTIWLGCYDLTFRVVWQRGTGSHLTFMDAMNKITKKIISSEDDNKKEYSNNLNEFRGDFGWDGYKISVRKPKETKIRISKCSLLVDWKTGELIDGLVDESDK